MTEADIMKGLSDFQKCLTFIHAFVGCDTASSKFGQGNFQYLDYFPSSKNKKRSLIAREAAGFFAIQM